ncbi:MAG: hypothetical protein GY855_10015 [candidate division Zixibacteria bacterium]|nr:hypothetical protein [candidate division Zixibacteria bacterium]
MADKSDNYQELQELHQRALEGYQEMHDLALGLLEGIRTGLDSNKLSELLKTKDNRADKLLEMANEIAELRQSIKDSGGHVKILKSSVDKFNEKLQPIMTKIIRIDNEIGEELKRTGIRISNRNP